MGNISFNPFVTTNAPGTFGITSFGYKQGDVLPNPAGSRYELASGILASTETLPMWGGVAIVDYIPSASISQANTLGTMTLPNIGVGGGIVRATLNSQITGFSTNDNLFSAVNTPQSPVPLVASGGTVNIYRLGSNARLVVACDVTLAAALQAGTVSSSQQVSWDFTNQQLVQYAPYTAANVVTAMSWASTNGGTVTATTTSAHGLVPGNRFTITGAVPAAYNGDWIATTGTTGSTLVYLLPAASTPGTVTTQGTVSAEGGALPVKILEVNVGNSLTVAYNAATGFATWNNSGTVAVIQL